MAEPPAPTDHEIQQLLARVLAREEYEYWRPGRPVSAFIHWLDLLRVAHPIAYGLIVGALLAVSVLMLVLIVRSVRATLGAATSVESPPSREGPAAFLAEAEALARGGRFLEAARHVQLGVIAVLLHARVIELGRSDPNRILRRRLREAALAETDRQELLALVDRLERGWFRDRRDDADLYEAWRALHVRLEAGLVPA